LSRKRKFRSLLGSIRSRPENFREKIIIGNKGESIEETIARVLKRYPNAKINAAVTDRNKQSELSGRNVLSLVFEAEAGPCNFRQLEGVVAALRALSRDDRETLFEVYHLLTGSPFEGPVAQDIGELIKALVFKLPPAEIKNTGDLKRLNENIITFIQAA
jgi:hypothetical protein